MYSLVIIHFYIHYFAESKPDKVQVFRLLSPIAYKWYEIGEALNIDYGDLMSLQQSYFSDKRRLSEVFQLWIDGRPTEVKWSVIITAVELPPVDDLSVAENIRHFLSIKNE